jgi:plasmid stabilization system protein ParE
MTRLIRSRFAEADLNEIVDYIAADNPSAAFAWLESMESLF